MAKEFIDRGRGEHMRWFVLVLAAVIVARIADGQDAEDYRSHALTNAGDAGRGKVLFRDARLLCASCHSVDGSASKAGPDLFAAGDAFGRRDLVESVLKPSATIAPGYGTVVVETVAGETYAGTLKQKTAEKVELMGVDGKLVSLAADAVKSQTGSAVSLMPEGLYAGVSRDEFTDLIEYLTTLKEPASARVSAAGAPVELPELARPVAVRAFFSEGFTRPRGKAESGLSSMRQVPGFPGVFLVLHQTGVIWRVVKKDDGEAREVFLDLATEVFSERGPNGLLDVAFHPGFGGNGRYYLFYQVFEDRVVTTRIVERRFGDDFRGDSGEAERVLMRIQSVAEDHSGGCLEFGVDGFLYLVMGDTGPHHDPNGHAQNMGILLGKVLRIDVDRKDAGLEYAVPADNPFVGREGVRPEIWATGFRNPWRFCFDRATGELWLADVGQDRVEEVDVVGRGQNYGWNVFEGFEAFSNQYRKAGEAYAAPVFAYRRRYGNSITGGHVYRGDAGSSFYGVYVCGDYNSKLLFGVRAEGGELQAARVIGRFPQRLVSFCEDESGALYGVGYEGMVYRIDFSDARFE